MPRDVRNSKGPLTWQVQERMVSTSEQMQVPNGTGPGVRGSKRPLLASRTRCNVPWKCMQFYEHYQYTVGFCMTGLDKLMHFKNGGVCLMHAAYSNIASVVAKVHTDLHVVCNIYGVLSEKPQNTHNLNSLFFYGCLGGKFKNCWNDWYITYHMSIGMSVNRYVGLRYLVKRNAYF